MGKRERHAAKLSRWGGARTREGGQAKGKGRGFKAGFGWGVESLWLFAKHPLYLGAGHVAMLLAGLCAWAVAAAWAPAGFVAGILFMVALAAGIPAAASAARARAAAKEGRAAPWGAWVEGWRGWRRAGSSTLRALAAAMAVAGLSAACQYGQQAMAAQDPKWMLGWHAQAMSVGTMWAMAVWAAAAAAPSEAGWRRRAMGALRMAASPGSAAGLACFWIVWLALCGLAGSWLFTEALGLVFEGAGDAARRSVMAPLTAFATIATQLPMMAMSAGFAWDAMDRARIEASQAEEAEVGAGVEAGPGAEAGREDGAR